MSAPPPVVKETLSSDPGRRTGHMVTLRRGGKTSGGTPPANEKSGGETKPATQADDTSSVATRTSSSSSQVDVGKVIAVLPVIPVTHWGYSRRITTYDFTRILTFVQTLNNVSDFLSRNNLLVCSICVLIVHHLF